MVRNKFWLKSKIIMKPTKKERNLIYKDTLKYVKKEGWIDAGFCFNIAQNSSYKTYGKGLYHNFPEIYKRKPKKKYNLDYYFPTYTNNDPVREAILKLAIKDTNPKKK